MSDNLKILKQNLDVAIDPNAGVGQILAQNHNDVFTEFINKSGKFTGLTFNAVLEGNAGVIPVGTFSWNGNAMNESNDFIVTTSVKTTDLNNITPLIDNLVEGDVIKFKDFVGRSVLYIFKGYATGVDDNNNDVLNITLSSFADNINYSYQSTENEPCVLDVYINSSNYKNLSDKYTEGELNNFVYPDWYNGIKIPVNYKDGKFITNYDVENEFELLLNTETPYYVSPTGSNTNDGLTIQTPLASVTKAGDLGAKLIYVLEGVYQYNTFPSLTSNGFDGLPNGDLAIIGIGDVKFTAYRPSSQQPFTDEGGGVWKAVNDTYANLTDSVVDLEIKDEFGYDLLYTQVTSLVDCQNTLYTWYFDTVNLDIYVNIGVGRTLVNGQNIVVNTNSTWGIRSDQNKLFIKNIEFMDRLNLRGVSGGSNFSVYMKNVRMLQPKRNDIGANGLNGVELEGADGYLQDCISRNATLDGFNYHNVLGKTNMKVLELNCIAFNPSFGKEGLSNQSSTAHSDNNNIAITRINGYYDGGSAGVITDVNTDCQSVLIGCSIIQENDVDATVTNGGGYRGVDAYLFGCYLSENAPILAQTPSNYGVTVEKCLFNKKLTTGNVIIIE